MDYTLTSEGRGDWHRNIVSLRSSIDLFGDLVTDPKQVEILIGHEIGTKLTTAATPIINRPFEDAEIYDPIQSAIEWPFDHPSRTRYSDGAFGVWYGAGTLETSIYETAHHFRINTLASEIAANSTTPIVQERRVHLVHCNAMLVDLRILCSQDPRLTDAKNYSFCQQMGLYLKAASQPGVISQSVRHAAGTVVGVFARESLGDPRNICYLTYSLDVKTSDIEVQRIPGKTEWMMQSP